MSDVVGTLTRAVEVIDRRGWRQGRRVAGQRAVCASEAIEIAASTDAGERAAYAELSAQLGGASVVRWQDDKDRTEHEVRALFAQAIKAAA